MAPITYIAVIALVCCALPAAFAETGLTEEEEAEILRAHNHFRGMVQPVATDMERMVRPECAARMLNVCIFCCHPPYSLHLLEVG